MRHLNNIVLLERKAHMPELFLSFSGNYLISELIICFLRALCTEKVAEAFF